MPTSAVIDRDKKKPRNQTKTHMKIEEERERERKKERKKVLATIYNKRDLVLLTKHKYILAIC
jgi:hypothetical protein